jgi:hypothetical protein
LQRGLDSEFPESPSGKSAGCKLDKLGVRMHRG